MRHFIPGCLLSISLLACSDRPTPTDAPGLQFTAAGGQPTVLHYPGDIPGPAYYSTVSAGFVPTDGGWVGIVFWRAPECVRADYNMLSGFDRPAAWGCTLTVEGESWWHDPAVPPPYMVLERGLGAVPVYFVALSEYQAAIADGVLTIGELQALPSLLVGYASFLQHETHNTSEQNFGHETLVSYGVLEDGRRFQFRYNEKFFAETNEHVFPNVKITFE